MRAAAPHGIGPALGRGPLPGRGPRIVAAVAVVAIAAVIVFLAVRGTGHPSSSASHSSAAGSHAPSGAGSTSGSHASGLTANASAVHRPPPIVYRPAGFGSARLPLVVALYGFGGCPQCMEGVTGFESLARQNGFVVAYPGSASAPPWNSPSDLGYVRSFIDRLIAGGGIDPSRVYLAGFSGGGRATYQYGCALSARLAAIAIVSSVMRGYPCPLRHPVSELAIVGSTEHAALLGNASGIPSAATTAARWRRMDGCSGLAGLGLSRAGIGGVVAQQLWGPCLDGSRVGLYVLAGGYHTWPGTSSAHFPDNLYNASAAIWQFFSTVRASSWQRPDASLTRVSSGRQVDATLIAGEGLTVTATLIRGARRLAARSWRLGAGAATLTLGVAQRVKPGSARLRLVISDTYGRHETISRRVHVG